MGKVIFCESIVHVDENEPSSMLTESLARVFSPGDRVAVKLHMGEEGNRTALSPSTALTVVKALKKLGARPFLFDSPVVYNSPRNTPQGYLALAARRGFSLTTMGCPVVVADESIPLLGAKMEYHLCKELAEADGICLLSHVKGHPCTGLGGAIKNIGMGAMSKETKGAIHEGGKPVYSSGCNECRRCVEMCPTGNIRLAEGAPRFDVTYCTGCSNCAIVCETGSIEPMVDTFDRLLAEATALALGRLAKTFYINCLINITELCDCASNSGRILTPDVGFVLGEDICSVERASYEMIVNNAGEDVFFAIHHRSPEGHMEILRRFLNKPEDYLLTS